MKAESLPGVRERSGPYARNSDVQLFGSGVSWAAVVAGAVGSAALSLILLILGSGLGLSSVSPWTGEGASAGSFGVATILWVSLTQLAAAGMGGYLAGRLRNRWHELHTDEVYFRDTAHGFLAWALATLLTAALLTSAISTILGGGVRAGVAAGAPAAVAAPAMATGAAAVRDSDASGQRYFVESLFRRDPAGAAAGAAPLSTTPTGGEAGGSPAEVERILATALSNGTLPVEDSKYVGQIVAQRTGMPQADAERRVADTFARMQEKAKQLEAGARDAADKARKASAYGALWLFVSLLVGAFCASLAATFGGRRRDQF